MRFENEFDADRDTDVNTLNAYRDLEKALFDELDEKVFRRVTGSRALSASRFNSDSVFSSRNHEVDWNRTAEHFFAQGYHVLVPRLPGDGTAPGGLLQAHWEGTDK